MVSTRPRIERITSAAQSVFITMATEETLNLEQKLLILSKISDGFMLTDLAKSYRVSLSEIVRIKLDEAAIDALVNSSYFQVGESMSYRPGQSPRMQNILYAWYVAETKKRTLSNREICNKALEINKIVRENTKVFKATIPWCTVFKKRFNLNTINVDKLKENNKNDTFVRQEVMDTALTVVLREMGVDITQVIRKSYSIAIFFVVIYFT